MKYPYIYAWGTFMGSEKSFITGQQALAERENAPHDAIFRKYDGGWNTFSNTSTYTQQMIKESVEKEKEVT